MVSMDENRSLAKTTIHGTLWMYAAMYSGKFINLISLTILARLLLKEEFGIANFALVFVSMIDFPGLGIGPALIYHDKDSKRTNSGFWLAILVGILMTIGTLWGAPLMGDYFKDPRAIPVIRGFAVYFLFVAFGVVPSSILNKDLSFKQKFIPDLIGSLSKGFVSVTMAFMGFGAWSLIAGNLMQTLVVTIVLWIVWRTDWRPSFQFDIKEAWSILKYAGSIVSIYLLAMLIMNIDYLLIGRFLGAAALGVYSLGFRIPELLIKQFYVALSQVLFPVFTKMRAKTEVLGQGFLISLRYILMITAPAAIGLALLSRPLVLLIFGEKWSDAIPVMAAISFYILFLSMDFNSGDAFKAQGRPDIIPRIQIVNVVVAIPVLWWAVVHFGTIVAVAWAQVALAVTMGAFRLLVAAHLLQIPKNRLIQLFQPLVISTGIMAASVLAVLQLVSDSSPLVQLVLAIPTGALVYGASLWVVEREAVLQASKLLRSAVSGGSS